MDNCKILGCKNSRYSENYCKKHFDLSMKNLKYLIEDEEDSQKVTTLLKTGWSRDQNDKQSKLNN